MKSALCFQLIITGAFGLAAAGKNRCLVG